MHVLISCETFSTSCLCTYTVFPKMHFCCIISSLSPYFFMLLPHTSAESTVILFVHTITAMHDLITYVERHSLLICEASFLNHKTHNPVLFLSSFLVSSFLCHSLLCIFRNTHYSWMVFVVWH